MKVALPLPGFDFPNAAPGKMSVGRVPVNGFINARGTLVAVERDVVATVPGGERLDGYAIPVSRQIRRETQRASGIAHLDAQQAADDRQHHHGLRPHLVMRRPAERRGKIAGQQLRDVAERARFGEQRVGHERLIADMRTSVAVRRDRGPSGEQGPDRSVVIRQRIVQGAPVGQDAMAPVGGERRASQMIDLELRALVVHRAKPERYGWQHRVLRAVGVQGEGLEKGRCKLPDGAIAGPKEVDGVIMAWPNQPGRLFHGRTEDGLRDAGKTHGADGGSVNRGVEQHLAQFPKESELLIGRAGERLA